MTKPSKRVPAVKTDFFEEVAMTVENAKTFIGRTVDLAMCITYFEIGRMIVEEEQGGKTRAEYGHGLLGELSEFLTGRFGKGFSVSTLTNARKFYATYYPAISQAVLTKSDPEMLSEKSQAVLTKSYPFKLSWTHYLILMRIENPDERQFYEIEAETQQWSYRQLQRQYGSSLYERLVLSRGKKDVARLAKEGHTVEKPEDVLKNPLVLEFLGMEDDASYSETELENAIIGKLQAFLLELGKGFLFEARQKRFTFEDEHFKVDLVLYNRLLKCYVLIDLKTEKLKHQDLGQMQMYVHYFDRYVKTKSEYPTIGILLCQKKSDTVVELTLPEDENIYATEYSLYLPDKELLQKKVAEWIREFEDTKEALRLNVKDSNSAATERCKIENKSGQSKKAEVAPEKTKKTTKKGDE